jgi:hypothetical protein
MRTDKSTHILNAASNLLGLCFIVLTSLKFLKISQRTYIDEMVTFALIFFMVSCILSFLSIRGSIKAGGRLETTADYLFLSGMAILFITSLLILFNVMA